MASSVTALEAFRPIVHAVSELHSRGIVHRDIKPHNIFIGNDGRLILGDLGLVFFTDDAHSRVSSILENVGSRDWMPGWAMGMKIDDIRPTFDVFSLGKLLWSMISGMSFLQLWYFRKDRFNIEMIFPNDPSMRWTQLIFEKCIVEEEKDCMPSANELLQIVDKSINAVQQKSDIIQEGITRRCVTCGLGTYSLVVNGAGVDAHNFGIRPTGTSGFKIYTCNHCGHTQMFHLQDVRDPPSAWREL